MSHTEIRRNSMAIVHLKANIRKRTEKGHPWVYKNEVEKIEGDFQPGDTVTVVNPKGKFIAKGYINPNSLILVRVMTRDEKEEINMEFLRSRITRA